LLLDVVHVVGRLEAGDDVAFAVDEELGEVPFDIGLLCEVGVGLAEHVVQERRELMAFVEAFEAFLFLQPGVERHLVLAVDVGLGELWEHGTVGELAELGDFFVCARSLLAELVAGEVEDFETLVVQAFVHGLEGFVLRGEAATAGSVDDEEHLALELSEADIVLLLVLDGEVVDGFHCFIVLG